MKELLPQCPVGALVENNDLQFAGYYCHKYGFDFYHPDCHLLTKANVDNCKEYGIGINTWTVNDLGIFETMVEWGVEGVIGNFPGVPKAWLKAQG